MAENPRLLTRFNDEFYAFDKPAGMAVHHAGPDIPDLVAWIDRHPSFPAGLRPGHRLDRATSGIVLCGATRRARATIGDWLTSTARKQYVALVAGTPPTDEGTLTFPLVDHRRKRPLACTTHYRIRTRFNGFTLLEIHLITGRKHQIRRHLATAHLPIVGDQRYGPKRPRRVPGYPGRLWLHAARLEVAHKTIESPLPTALLQHLTLLRDTT